ncbi:MAG: hypothetical protein U5N85_12820 [Arcicella sp.]|nr:hypothetical protein [Arcicella sp.]
MNNSITARIKAFLPSIFMLFLLFLMTLGRKGAATTFSTDSSWRVTQSAFAGWFIPTYALMPAWVVPGVGKVLVIKWASNK